MIEAKRKPTTRVIEKQMEIAAPAETVWKALTDPAELARWFPLEAHVEPGKGGKISLSWGSECEGMAQIEIWEPNKQLRWMESDSKDRVVAVEWTIEARGGKIFLHLTQSSFTPGSDWDNEFYDSTNYGWGFMLVNLRHYLERHAGQSRLVAWPRLMMDMPREAIFERLVAPKGIFAEGVVDKLREGDRYSLRVVTGEPWSGRVEFLRPPRGFCVTVEPLNDALAWLTIEGAGGKHDVQIWFSTYGLPQAQVTEIEKRWADELKRILS